MICYQGRLMSFPKIIYLLMTLAQYKSCRLMGESVIRTQLTMMVPQKQSLPRYDCVGWSQLWDFKQNKSLWFSVENTMAQPRSGPLKTSRVDICVIM